MQNTVVHKKELTSVLENTDLKDFIVSLQDQRILSCGDNRDIESLLRSLDHNQVDSSLVARFIVNRIPNELPKGMWEKYLEVLGNFESTAGLRNTLDNDENISNVCVGQKWPLYEIKEIALAECHVPDLTSLLSECAHKWEEIAIMLRLPQHVIEECRTGSSNFIKLNSVLLAWIRQDRARPATLQGLSKVLSSGAVNMHSLGETLHDKFKKHLVKQEPGIKKTRLSSQGSIIVVNDGTFALLGVQDEYEENNAYQWEKDGERLCDNLNFYCTTEDVLLIRNVRQGLEGKYSCTQDGKKVFEMQIEVEFSPEKKKLLNKYSVLEAVPNSWPPIGTSTYIELALVHNQKNTKCDYSVRGDMDDILEKKDKIQYEELFAEHRDSTLLVVEGRPGCGKTTLTHKISRDWSKSPNILKGAIYVFLIPLRLFSKTNAKSLSAVLNIIFRSENISKTVADLLENCDGKGACFIIDGLDEYKDRNDPNDIVYQILHKECLPLAMVIVASRPAGTAELRQLAQKRIEVLGFSKTQIFKYFEEYDFKTGVNSARSLENYLNRHVNVYHMCYLPVHAAMICYIYDNNGEVPNTETKIYNLFTLLTIKRKLSQDGDQSEVSKLDKLTGNLNDYFRNVCKLAFDMTVSSKQAMFRDETENCLSDEIGSKIHSLGLVTIDTTARLLGYVDLYAFLHLTFQEFLAAYHLSTLNMQDQLRLIGEHKEKSDMNVMWKFFCGLTIFEDEEGLLLGQIMTTKSSSNLFRFQCALESQQKFVCDSSFQIQEHIDGSVVIKDHIFPSIDLNAMGFTIANSSFLVTSLVLDNCSLNSDGVQSFIEQVGPIKLDLIKSIQFSTSGETEQFKILNFLLYKLNSLEFLHLAGMELDSNNIEMLTNNIELPNLKVLVIRMPLAQCSDDMDSIRLLSFNSRVLEQVRYNYVDADHESHKTSLLKLLKLFTCEVVSLNDPPLAILCNFDVDLVRVPNFLNICTVLLVNCNINDEGVRYLKDVGINDIIVTLRLDFNKITCNGARLISECLKLYNSLHTLSVSCNLIGDVGALALSEALQYSSLLELDLQGNKISNEGAIAIAQAIKHFPSNFSLKIWNMNITPEGADNVIKYRPNAQVKNQHEICAMRYIITNSLDTMTRTVSCFANLVCLDFSGKNMTCHAAEALATSIKLCIHLKSLNLDNCGLSSSVFKQLGEGLQKCRNLATVNFASNGIQSTDISKLIAPLKLCPNLQELDLHDNPLQNDGIDSLARELSRCQLTSLNLSNTKIDQNCAALLARYLRLGAGQGRISRSYLFVDQEPFSEFLLDHLNKEITNISIHFWYTSLKVLDLGNNKVDSKGAAALAYGIEYCTKLETLNISQNNIDAFGASMLAHGFKSCSELKKLILCNNPLKADGATSVFTALQCCNNLQVLYCQNIDLLSSNSMEGEELDRHSKLKGIVALASALKFWNNFTELNISRNSIDCKGVIKLAVGLKQVKHLEKLDISKNKIAIDGMTAISKSLRRAHLTSLDLSDKSITHVGALAQGEILSNCNEIASLNISSTDIGTEGAEMLGNGLRNCPKLMEVYLASNKIGSRGVKLLLDGLKNCTKLKLLDLSDNNIGSKGVAELISEINYFCELDTLELSNNNICVDGCRTIKNWLLCKQQEGSVGQRKISSISCLQKFKSLSLADNNFGQDGALEIASGVQHCSNFQLLNLEGNNIGSVGAILLGERLKNCHNLRWVQLNNNQIDSESAVELAKRLKCCANLRRLDISHNSSIDLFALTNILRHCRIYSDYGWTNYDEEKQNR